MLWGKVNMKRKEKKNNNNEKKRIFYLIKKKIICLEFCFNCFYDVAFLIFKMLMWYYLNAK